MYGSGRYELGGSRSLQRRPALAEIQKIVICRIEAKEAGGRIRQA